MDVVFRDGSVIYIIHRDVVRRRFDFLSLSSWETGPRNAIGGRNRHPSPRKNNLGSRRTFGCHFRSIFLDPATFRVPITRNSRPVRRNTRPPPFDPRFRPATNDSPPGIGASRRSAMKREINIIEKPVGDEGRRESDRRTVSRLPPN